MADSRKALIQQSLVVRLKTITLANGYRTDVQNVYSDEIPMGLDLEPQDLPAILVIAGKDTIKHQTQWVVGNWVIELQLIHSEDQTDTTMHNYLADVHKAVFANSPTIVKSDAWRTFDGKPTSFMIIENDTDLNMIDGNRFYGTSYMVQYHAHPTDL